MLIYNQITELVAAQFLPIALFEAAALAILLWRFKIRPDARLILRVLAAALALALLSTLTARGFYGGMAYHEHYGWPFPFLMVSRHIEAGTQPAVPFRVYFDGFKFCATTVFWAFPSLMLMLAASGKPTKRSVRLSAAFCLAGFALLAAGFSLFNARLTVSMPEAPLTEITLPQADEQDILSRKMAAIESYDPRFKDFDSQQGFAGQSVKTVSDGSDHYFAYMVHGSGVPIAQAFCFRVDRLFRVYLVGEFPDPADSYYGYRDINPLNCRGIR